jgi:N-acetylneuraminic acid mutarotase
VDEKSKRFSKRSEFAGVVYNSKLYAFLGLGSSALEPNVSSEVYDPATDKWSLLASIPNEAAMSHQGVVLIDNTVWHIGGRVGKHPGPLTSDIWIYNITTNSWSRGPRLTDPATGNSIRWAAGGAVLLGRTLHIFGGFTIDACDNDQNKYHLTLDVDTWLSDKSKPAKWKNNLAPLPKKRNHISSTVLGGKIYAIGGQFGHDCGGGLDQRLSHVYNPSTDTWTELPLLPTPRSHSEGSVFAMDGKIFLVAGQKANNESSGKVTVFEPEGNNGEGKWEDDNSLDLPKPYEGLLAKVIGNTFIISGGGNGWSGNPRRETYARSIARNPVYKLEFSSGCSNLQADEGSVVKVGHCFSLLMAARIIRLLLMKGG